MVESSEGGACVSACVCVCVCLRACVCVRACVYGRLCTCTCVITAHLLLKDTEVRGLPRAGHDAGHGGGAPIQVLLGQTNEEERGAQRRILVKC